METIPKKNYDVAVAYRIYPKTSIFTPVFIEDKLKMSELCLKSFRRALGTVKAKLFIILDACPPEYEELFRKYFDDDDLEFIRLDKPTGNAATFGLQMELLLNQNHSELIYFAEDDYFYLPDTFSEMLEFMQNNKDVDFISPFDHPDYYTLELHNYSSRIKFSGKRHWRTASTACMTFLTTKDTLRKTHHSFKSYMKNNYDSSLFMSMTKYKLFNPLYYYKSILEDIYYFKILIKAWVFTPFDVIFGRKRKLWVPIPSIATHLDKRSFAYGFDWYELFKENEP
ncbi:MAG: glycosyl transferase family 2 [Ignavibacteria bacterium]|nr:glycosyl transferase family 2 [Ignavibacteria bacterium]